MKSLITCPLQSALDGAPSAHRLYNCPYLDDLAAGIVALENV